MAPESRLQNPIQVHNKARRKTLRSSALFQKVPPLIPEIFREASQRPAPGRLFWPATAPARVAPAESWGSELPCRFRLAELIFTTDIGFLVVATCWLLLIALYKCSMSFGAFLIVAT